MKHMAHEALQEFLHFDSKVFRTLPLLILRPGRLTQKTLAGEKGFVKPFPLFVLINFFFFLLKRPGLLHYTLDQYGDGEFYGPRTAHYAAELHLSMPILAERFNTAMRFEQKEYLVIMVPLFALLLQAIYWFPRRSYAVHLVFALHFYSWFILYMILLPLLYSALALLFRAMHISRAVLASEDVLVLVLFGSCFCYLIVALRHVYRDAWPLACGKALLAASAVLVLLAYVYRTLLYFIVMHSISE